MGITLGIHIWNLWKKVEQSLTDAIKRERWVVVSFVKDLAMQP